MLALSIAVTMLTLTSCSERMQSVSKSPDGNIVIYEGRKSGAGPAPDSVRSYLSIVGADLTDDANPIFEGQDVGRICYSWQNSTELTVRISGGYVDRVAPQWESPEGRRVTIRYAGISGCEWRGNG